MHFKQVYFQMAIKPKLHTVEETFIYFLFALLQLNSFYLLDKGKLKAKNLIVSLCLCLSV